MKPFFIYIILLSNSAFAQDTTPFFVIEKSHSITLAFPSEIREKPNYKIYYTDWNYCVRKHKHKWKKSGEIPAINLKQPKEGYRSVVCWNAWQKKQIFVAWLCPHIWKNWHCKTDLLQNSVKETKYTPCKTK